jgi:hypothetical protein
MENFDVKKNFDELKSFKIREILYVLRTAAFDTTLYHMYTSLT